MPDEVSQAVEDIPSSAVDKSESHTGQTVLAKVNLSGNGGSSSSSSSSRRNLVPTKLYIGNLSVNINGKDLRKLFQRFGTVSDVDVVGTFAFVVMPNESEAEDAIRELHDQVIGGKKLIVEKKKPKSSPSQKPNLGGRTSNRRPIQIFVAKCKDVSEDKLKDIFGKFGSVSSVSRPRTKPDIAFVSMDNFFEARKAIDGIHRKKIEGVSTLLLVQLATNNLTRDGRPLNSLLQRGETVKLFVGNLAKDTEAKALGALFERYGPVYEAAVMKGKDFGFVHMLSRESAADAIVGLKGKSFNGNNLHVTLSNKRGMAINRNGSADAPPPIPGAMMNNVAMMRPMMPNLRLGSRSMAPRRRADFPLPLPDQTGYDPTRPDMFSDRGMERGRDPGVDQLIALQRQISDRLFAIRGGGGLGGGLGSLPSGAFDAFFNQDLPRCGSFGVGNRSPERRHPDGFGPERRHPDAFGPERRHPDAFGPERRHPDGFGPEARFPDGFGPERRHPDAFGLERRHPDAIGPEGRFPDGFGPERRHPDGFGPEGRFPDARSRFGGNLSPLKRARSPAKGMRRLSPSPKRNFMDQRMEGASPARNGIWKPTGAPFPMEGEPEMGRRKAARTVPPKMLRPGFL